jgi:hypothetical protein
MKRDRRELHKRIFSGRRDRRLRRGLARPAHVLIILPFWRQVAEFYDQRTLYGLSPSFGFFGVDYAYRVQEFADFDLFESALEWDARQKRLESVYQKIGKKLQKRQLYLVDGMDAHGVRPFASNDDA